ncbi:site-specific DNA-methyltransferase [Nesterenkonia muleiensis]|uniref:site-specific DNA-methyltransferase n=1 Tax=Nesterenkonia muleiensis TaxID=2282648 RepID=UPI000E738F3B|nr:site-specific DNA-methyltransferase [Nesterenkonia muleiensis]
MHDELNEIPGATPDFRTELAEKLAELVPEAVADGKIDTKKLEELLDGDAADTRERFGLFWPGKKRALRAAQEPTTATLVPDKDNSKDWDTTQNVFIEGDNLEVLKILQKHYHGKIKMIYIDPPYNTGQDFVYPDNYQEGLKSYLEFTKQVDEGGKKLSTNSDQAGRYHSNWLNMMYPRLKLARNLLTDDGAIFISIDDHESGNLRRLCDEMFGEANFQADISWQKRYTRSNNTQDFTTVVEHLLVYSRSESFVVNLLPRTGEADERYANPDNDPRGPWKGASFLNPATPAERPNLSYPLINPNTGNVTMPDRKAWRRSESEFNKLQQEGRLYWGRDGTSAVPSIKMFLSEARGLTPVNFWEHSYAGNTDEGTRDVSKLFGRDVFNNPKPVRLLQRVLEHASAADSLVLDFFAGSGTLGHAAMKLNAIDGGARRVIQVQLPEPVPSTSQAHLAGFRTIADISRERLRRATDTIEEEHSDILAERDKPLDAGFRAYKLSDTNFAKWRLTSDVAETELEQHLLSLRESADDQATQEALLTELLLKRGYSLTEQVDVFDVSGLEIHGVKDAEGDYGLLAYLNEHQKPTLEQLRALVDAAEAQIVILEDAFLGDDQLKTNLAQLCKSKGIELWTA